MNFDYNFCLNPKKRPFVRDLNHPRMKKLRKRVKYNYVFDSVLYCNGTSPNNFIYLFSEKDKTSAAGQCYAYILMAYIEDREKAINILMKEMVFYYNKRGKNIINYNYCLKVINTIFNEFIKIGEKDLVISSIKYIDEFSDLTREIIFDYYPDISDNFENIFKNNIVETFQWAIAEENCKVVNIIIDNHLDFLKSNIDKIVITKEFSRKAFLNYNIVNKISSNFCAFFNFFPKFSCVVRKADIATLLIFTGRECIVDIVNVRDPENLSIFMTNFPITEYLNKKACIKYPYLRLIQMYAPENFLVCVERILILLDKVRVNTIHQNIFMWEKFASLDRRNFTEKQKLLKSFAKKNVIF